MTRLKVLLGIFFITLGFSIFILGYFFYSTGGMGLVRIVQNYIIVNIPDKKYSWNDFIDRGADYSISGFYSSSTNNSISIWTLSGLKTFYNEPFELNT